MLLAIAPVVGYAMAAGASTLVLTSGTNYTAAIGPSVVSVVSIATGLSHRKCRLSGVLRCTICGPVGPPEVPRYRAVICCSV